MIVHVENAKRAWGVWRTAPHTPMHLDALHDTKKAAIASARSMLAKGWGDRFVVRRMDLGPATIIEDE